MTADTGDSSRKPPTPGRSFGPYKIIEPLGAGGMGEVYRARDSKLNRDVALKFLPEELSSDEQLLARFDREAKLLALVNHPNIATIHSIEEENGHPYLVLELVEGENLSKVLKAGPLAVGEALRVCRDIAAALEAAHSKGIVHRDLKPANVMVTPEGIVKVLDFGIAKPLKFGQAASDLSEDTPSQELTFTGTLIGTGPYMSPEQIRGKSAGTQVDIWAFGCLMYQLLTGRVAFGGDTLADTLTSILEREPDWSRLPAKTPESIKRLMKRCVKKDPTQRLQAIGDARIEIEETIRTPSKSGKQAAEGTTVPGWQLMVGAATMLAIGIAVGAIAMGALRPSAPPSAEFIDFTFPENVVLGLGNAPSIAVSRDGTSFLVVFRDGLTQRLYRRELDSPSGWTAIPGTDGAMSPFFSWEGDKVGFFADSKLWWIPYDGSAQPEQLAEAVAPRGGAWARDGTIYYSSNQTLWMTGIDHAALPLIDSDPDSGQADVRWPLILPDGETLLYTSWDGAASRETSVYMRSARSEEELVVANAGYVRYSPSQHLVFNRGDELYAIGFDPNSLTTSGRSFALNEAILVRAQIGVPFFAIAQQSGTFVRAPGGLLISGPVLVRMDATGQSVPEPLILEDYQAGLKFPRLSPDGSTLAVTIDGGGGVENAGDTFAGLIDLAGGGVLEAVVAGATTYAPEWNTKGDSLAYLSYDNLSIFSKPVRTTGDGQQLTETSLFPPVPTAWVNDRIFYNTMSTEDLQTVARDVWYISTSPLGSPVPFLVTDRDEYGAVPSSNDKWVAYVRREAGQEDSEVWVTSFSKDYERAVSTGRDCQEPTWSAGGRQLYFRCGDQMMAVDIQETPSGFEPLNRRALWNWPFADDYQFAKANYAYDAVREEFLMVSDDPIVTAINLEIVQNWHEMLRARAVRAGR